MKLRLLERLTAILLFPFLPIIWRFNVWYNRRVLKVYMTRKDSWIQVWTDWKRDLLG